jgi:hypothetical protein
MMKCFVVFDFQLQTVILITEYMISLKFLNLNDMTDMAETSAVKRPSATVYVVEPGKLGVSLIS